MQLLWRKVIRLNKSSNKSFIGRLIRSSHSIHPCGTPKMIFSKELYMLLMRAHCFWYLMYNYINLTAEPFIIYAANFAVTKSRGIHLKAFNTLVKLLLLWRCYIIILSILLLTIQLLAVYCNLFNEQKWRGKNSLSNLAITDLLLHFQIFLKKWLTS